MQNPPKNSRVSDAYRQIKEEIRTNRMPAGYQAPEPDIAHRLGMSRTPVREALIRLEAEGLIELIPRRGARVLPLQATDMREIYEILTAMEPEAAAALAGRRPSDAALTPLDAATTAMETALATGDLDGWAAADDRFHQLLLELHGNRRLIDFVGVLHDQSHRARMVTLRMRAPPEQSTADHRAILEHIRAGDADAARRAFRSHRQRAARELLTILETYRLLQL